MNKISVVIVNFNNDEEVKRLKNGLSSNNNISDIFVIDNSPPNKNLGFATAVNIGLKRALESGAEKVLLLNPDLIITNENINNLNKSDGDIVGPILKFTRGKNIVLDHGGKVNLFLGRAKHIENHEGDSGLGQNDEIRKIDYISGACMLIKREVFEKIGVFDERFFMYFEDVDFCLRACEAGFFVAVDPQVVVEHQITEHKFSNDKQKIEFNLQSNYHFIQKWVPWQFQPVAKFHLALISFHLKFS